MMSKFSLLCRCNEAAGLESFIKLIFQNKSDAYKEDLTLYMI